MQFVIMELLRLLLLVLWLSGIDECTSNTASGACKLPGY
jgi:hypothetical protein